jgi:hypothetical protein
MESSLSMQLPSGKWHEFAHIYYRDRMWRTDARKSQAMVISVVERDGMQLTDYERLNHATLRPVRAPGADTPTVEGNALDFAKRSLDAGDLSVERTTTVREHGPVEGVPTYLVVLDRPTDGFHAEILVDKRNDLPIRSWAKVHHPRQERWLEYSQEFRFNQPLSDQLFTLEPGKPVVRLPEARAALLKRWQSAAAKVGETAVYDGSVGPDGTVWLALTVPSGSDRPLLPSRIASEGGDYVRLPDFDPSNGADSAPVRIGGKDLVLTAFAPLRIGGPLPRQVNVDFAKRTPDRPSGSPRSAEGETVTARTRLPLRRQADDRPDFFPALNLDRLGFEIPLIAWRSRGRALEAAKDYPAAARAYERCADEYRNFVKYAGYLALEDAARCYDKGGMPDLAQKRRQQAAALKASGER